MTLQFEPIDLERQQDYLTRLARCPQVASDYSFLNIWAWAEEYGLSWAWDGPLVFIRQSRPQEVFWAPVGPWDEFDWVSYFSDAGAETFARVPETLAELWKRALGARVHAESERGHWDYVYAVSDLIELPGNRFHKKKNLLNQFTKSTDFTYTDFSRKTIEQAMAMQEDWCTWRDCESSDVLAAENRSIVRVLNNWDRFERERILGGALYVDQLIVAYTLAEPLTPETLVVHFEKGCPDYKGVYQAINQMFLARAAGEYRFVNREQDLDNEGLRKAKLSYQPVEFLKKFRVAVSA